MAKFFAKREARKSGEVLNSSLFARASTASRNRILSSCGVWLWARCWWRLRRWLAMASSTGTVNICFVLRGRFKICLLMQGIRSSRCGCATSYIMRCCMTISRSVPFGLLKHWYGERDRKSHDSDLYDSCLLI